MPPALAYQPIRCKNINCGSILNPFCGIDFNSKVWSCPFCGQRNHFPPQYAENITETNLPAELFPSMTTVEYELPLPPGLQYPPVFLFLVDTTLDEDQLESLKDSLLQSLVEIPDDALLGLITFGTHIYVHELISRPIPRSYAFRGTKTYDYSSVQEILGLTLRHTMDVGTTQSIRFLQPKVSCEFVFEKLVKSIEKDPWIVPSECRATRVTGNAISIAESLLECCIHLNPASVVCFIGGPCTDGPGKIIGTKLSETLRSHTDIKKGNATYIVESTKYYNEITERMVKNKHSFHLIGCCLDQIGIVEMENLIGQTGGRVVMADSFNVSVFKESFHRMFRTFGSEYPEHESRFLAMGGGATIEVLTTKEFQVSGCLGPCRSLNKKTPSTGENAIGEGETSEWYLGCIDPSTTLAFYFDITNPATNALPPTSKRYIQFITQYYHPNGHIHLRCSTVSGFWNTDPNNTLPLASSFDQECATVVMARLASHRMREEESSDILRWLDRSLIRLVSRFADYRPNDPSSLKLPNEFLLYPQFLFHLRRSQFVEGMNCSPDESVYYRLILLHQRCQDCLVMIQPALLSYSFQGAPVPVILDVTSVRADAILLLDTFFHIVVFHGSTMAQWREARYQDLPEHAQFKQLLELPQQHAQEIMEGRFPVPRYILCDQGRSQARFLMAKLNPSVSYRSVDAAHAPVFTDDVSLNVFMEHLWKIAVEQ